MPDIEEALVADSDDNEEDRWYSLDPITQYFRDMGQLRLISPEEEIALARKIREGDKEARDTMIKANLRLVVKIARDYEHLGLDLLDLISEGNIGLVTAVERFDPQGAKFATYGVWWIKQAMTRALDDQSRTIRLPVNAVEKLSKILRAVTDLWGELGREPTDAEVAKRLDIKEARVSQLRRSARMTSSLDAIPIGRDQSEGDSPYNSIPDDSASDTPESLLSRYFQKVEDFYNILSQLPEREQKVLSLRFGLDRDGDGRTLEEVGKIFGVTREMIRVIQNKALAKLKKKIELHQKDIARHVAAAKKIFKTPNQPTDNPDKPLGLAADGWPARLYAAIPDAGALLPLKLVVGGIIGPVWETWRYMIIPLGTFFIRHFTLIFSGADARGLADQYTQYLAGMQNVFIDAHRDRLFAGRSRIAVVPTGLNAARWKMLQGQVKVMAGAVFRPLEVMSVRLLQLMMVCLWAAVLFAIFHPWLTWALFLPLTLFIPSAYRHAKLNLNTILCDNPNAALLITSSLPGRGKGQVKIDESSSALQVQPGIADDAPDKIVTPADLHPLAGGSEYSLEEIEAARNMTLEQWRQQSLERSTGKPWRWGAFDMSLDELAQRNCVIAALLIIGVDRQVIDDFACGINAADAVRESDRIFIRVRALEPLTRLLTPLQVARLRFVPGIRFGFWHGEADLLDGLTLDVLISHYPEDWSGMRFEKRGTDLRRLSRVERDILRGLEKILKTYAPLASVRAARPLLSKDVAVASADQTVVFINDHHEPVALYGIMAALTAASGDVVKAAGLLKVNEDVLRQEIVRRKIDPAAYLKSGIGPAAILDETGQVYNRQQVRDFRRWGVHDLRKHAISLNHASPAILGQVQKDMSGRKKRTPPLYSGEAILVFIRERRQRFCDISGYRLATADLKKDGFKALYNAAVKIFGTWDAALQAAGVDPLQVRRKQRRGRFNPAAAGPESLLRLPIEPIAPSGDLTPKPVELQPSPVDDKNVVPSEAPVLSPLARKVNELLAQKRKTRGQWLELFKSLVELAKERGLPPTYKTMAMLTGGRLSRTYISVVMATEHICSQEVGVELQKGRRGRRVSLRVERPQPLPGSSVEDLPALSPESVQPALPLQSPAPVSTGKAVDEKALPVIPEMIWNEIVRLATAIGDKRKAISVEDIALEIRRKITGQGALWPLLLAALAARLNPRLSGLSIAYIDLAIIEVLSQYRGDGAVP
ncbi:MAG: sigma-70 family RNA polymerase sigma factor, partial [Candidatus Omnitrophica bacterium]|nr:sigma-70 family RNA polymerase sigma factor [Candidatus Omnitrophota bacterium]